MVSWERECLAATPLITRVARRLQHHRLPRASTLPASNGTLLRRGAGQEAEAALKAPKHTRNV